MIERIYKTTNSGEIAPFAIESQKDYQVRLLLLLLLILRMASFAF